MRPGPTHCFQYVDCDIPVGMTIQEWKRERAAATAPRRRGLLALVHSFR